MDVVDFILMIAQAILEFLYWGNNPEETGNKKLIRDVMWAIIIVALFGLGLVVWVKYFG